MDLRVLPVVAPQRQEDLARRVGPHELVDEGGVEREQVALGGPEAQRGWNGGEETVRGGNDIGEAGGDVCVQDAGGGSGGGKGWGGGEVGRSAQAVAGRGSGSFGGWLC